jgi:site-specific DNA-methyltransferase (adenine-specific)
MENLNTVIHGDWMENDLPDKSVQLIIADPPYFEVKGSFDFVWKSFDDYLKDVERWAIECKRLLADNGTLFWYGHAKNIAYAQVIFDKHFNLINNLVWNKGSFMGLEESEGLRSFAPCTERILMYCNYDYNNEKGFATIKIKEYLQTLITNKELQEILLKNKICSNKASAITVAASKLNKKTTRHDFIKEEIYNLINKPKKEYRELAEIFNKELRYFNNVFNLQEVLNFSNEATKTGAKYDHDTVKPETLTRALILTCSRPNDLVVVPFAGSGTEVAMAVREGRRAIGYDIEKKYVDMANNRVKAIQAQPSLFCSNENVL